MLPEGGAQPPESFRALLKERTPSFGLSLSASSLDALARFLAQLDRARRQTNLTGPLTSRDLVDHALESAMGASLIPPEAEVIDVGSGAGFPGVPLSILRPDSCVTLVEPRHIRAAFLRNVAKDVPLENCFVIEGRLADTPSGCGTVATARAVGQIERLLRDADALKPAGLFLAWTTDIPGVARRLGNGFQLEAQLTVPGSRKKVIASFRKRDVPRGTARRGRERS